MKIETTYSIGDVVYLASKNGTDREIIKAIKVTGLKNKVQYGFKKDNSFMFGIWYSGDDFYWKKASEVFEEEEDADRLSSSLKAKYDAEKAKEEAEEKEERRKQLKKQLEELDKE